MAQNRMLTDAELRRFRIEHAADIASMRHRGQLMGATDDMSPQLRAGLIKLALDEAPRRAATTRVGGRLRSLLARARIPLAADATIGDLVDLLDRINAHGRADLDYPPANRGGKSGPMQGVDPVDAEGEDESETDRRKSSEARRAYAEGDPSGAARGRQGINRPDYRTGQYSSGPASEDEVQREHEGEVDRIWREGHGGDEPSDMPHREVRWGDREDHARDEPSYFPGRQSPGATGGRFGGRARDKVPSEYANRVARDAAVRGRHGGRAIESDRFGVLTSEPEPKVPTSNFARPLTPKTQRQALGLTHKELMAADAALDEARVAPSPRFAPITVEPVYKPQPPKGRMSSSAEKASFYAHFPDAGRIG